MINKKPFYITTTLPYVNSEPHIGFAMEFVRADVIARYKKSLDYDIFFNTGTDEHGAKIYENAIKGGLSPQEFVDNSAQKFKDLQLKLNILSDVYFIRTTDDNHIASCYKIWDMCFQNGDIYKKEYKIKYCIGCELEKTDSELVDNKCELHPDRDIEIREEENYFFRFSKYQKPLLDFYKDNPNFVIPDFRFNEIKSFVERGLEDFSVSRLATKMPWGVKVPNDEDHVMYVWFDALTNYISTLNWPDGENYKKYWEQGEQNEREVIQYCGKDNLRQQSAMWQAMLMSAKLPNSTNIIINGFITGANGIKMSKSLGNVISPNEVIDMFKDVTDYPEDVLRFVLLHDISSFEDGSMSIESIKHSYQSNLQNGIGNLTNRVMKMATSYGVQLSEEDKKMEANGEGIKDDLLEKFDIAKRMNEIWVSVSSIDEDIQKNEPFKKIKVDEEGAKKDVYRALYHLYGVALMLQSFLPHTSAKILECIRENKMPEKPLFGRL